ERLALDQRQSRPVADEIAPELAARLLNHAVGGQLDEVLGLFDIELVLVHEAEPEGRGADALREVGGVEAEPETQELDDYVVPGRVVVRVHGWRIARPLDCAPWARERRSRRDASSQRSCWR